MTIYFRSLRARHAHRGESLRFMKARGNDWNALRIYTQDDDSRSIVWKKSTDLESIYTMEYMDTTSLSIQLYIHRGIGDEFCSTDSPISRSTYYHNIRSILRESTKAQGHHYTEVHRLTTFDLLKPKNSLIIIAGNSLDSGLYHRIKTLSPHNDVIFLHIFHPIENTGSHHILFFGKILGASYQYEWKQEQQRIKTSLHKLGSEYIDIPTNEDIENRLNYFFKTRFQHG